MKIMQSLKPFLMKSKRVWVSLKKPTRKEYEQVAKISAIGIVILGILGFVISIIMSLFI